MVDRGQVQKAVEFVSEDLNKWPRTASGYGVEWNPEAAKGFIDMFLGRHFALSEIIPFEVTIQLYDSPGALLVKFMSGSWPGLRGVLSTYAEAYPGEMVSLDVTGEGHELLGDPIYIELYTLRARVEDLWDHWLYDLYNAI